MMRLALTLSLTMTVLAGSGCAEPEDTTPDATAELAPLGASGVSGTVKFTQLADGKVQVEADISGLTPGMHGMHVHEFGDCSAPDGMSAGGHFNPDGVDHGPPGSATHHPGDFGNLAADANGRATFNLGMDTATVSLTEGKYAVAGRAIIVHEKPDDFRQPPGNAGGRLACGLIEEPGGTSPVLMMGS
jgi:Cu-Zn family superoxide dismutase